MEFLKGISPREYQIKIFETCKGQNCLVVLPTGLGKTLIALLLVIDRINKFPGQKVLFLAPTRPLCEQHLSYFKKHLPDLFVDIDIFTGQVQASTRRKIWQTADIIFSTPQCISNDIKNSLYDLSEVCLLVEDEAHRCLKNYAYNYVAKKYKEQSINQRILGLTASPGHEQSKILDICKNLSIEHVEVRQRTSEDVKTYLQELQFEKVTVDFPQEFEDLRRPLKQMYESYVDELKRRNVLFGPVNKVTLLNLQNKLFASAKYNTHYNNLLAISACSQAIRLQHALELLETQTLTSFLSYLENLRSQARKGQSRGVERLVNKPEFTFLFLRTKHLLEKGYEHPKIKELLEIVKREKENNANLKVIVFTQFRESAQIISTELNALDNIKSKVFIGQAKRATGKVSTGLSQQEQKAIIGDFAEGKINILCATSIGEEGLDIPEVNAVIFYEPVPSAIRKIQRAGRTARLMEGKLIILITKNTRDEAYYYASRSREKKMYSALTLVKQGLEGNGQQSVNTNVNTNVKLNVKNETQKKLF